MQTLIFLGLVGLFSAFIFYILSHAYIDTDLKRQTTVILTIFSILLMFNLLILLLDFLGIYAQVAKIEKNRYPVSQYVLLNLTVFIFSQISVTFFEKCETQVETFHKWMEALMIPAGSIIICYVGSRDIFCTWKDIDIMLVVGISILSFNAGSYLLNQRRNYQNISRIERQHLKHYQVQGRNICRKSDGIQAINQYIQSTQEQWSKLVQVHHNLKNSYILEMGYLEKGRFDLLREHYEKNIELLKFADIVRTQNIGIDYILNNKIMFARENNITVTYEIKVQNEIKIQYEDLTDLFGNLMDNAIEAAMKADAKKKQIFFRLCSDTTSMLFHIRNSFSGKCIQDEKGVYITEKADIQNHGIGLQVVQKIVKAHNGKIEITHSDTDFFVTAFLMMDSLV